MRHEWLITSAECIDAKRRRRQDDKRAPPPRAPSPGFGGDKHVPENEQTAPEPHPNEKQKQEEQPVGFPS